MEYTSKFAELSYNEMIEIDGGITGAAGVAVGALTVVGTYYACKKILDDN